MSVVPIPFPDKALIFIQVSTFSSGGPVLKGTEPHSQLWDVSCLLGTTGGNPTALPLNGLGTQASAIHGAAPLGSVNWQRSGTCDLS